MHDDIFVSCDATLYDLFEEYGSDLALASVFEVECECGEIHRLEPDGYCTCPECGKKVLSPLVKYGVI